MNLERWSKMARPPADALKQIQAGRLKGKSDTLGLTGLPIGGTLCA